MSEPKGLPLVRTATAADAEEMAQVEKTARALLREKGVDLTTLNLSDDSQERTGWDLGLVAEMGVRIVGIARLSELETDLVALDQVSVHPSMSRQGVGRALLLAAVELCRDRGYTAMTGTTFRDVIFNAPFYATLGAVEDTAPHPQMLGRREVEASCGLDRLGQRVVMRLAL